MWQRAAWRSEVRGWVRECVGGPSETAAVVCEPVTAVAIPSRRAAVAQLTGSADHRTSRRSQGFRQCGDAE